MAPLKSAVGIPLDRNNHVGLQVKTNEFKLVVYINPNGGGLLEVIWVGGIMPVPSRSPKNTLKNIFFHGEIVIWKKCGQNKPFHQHDGKYWININISVNIESNQLTLDLFWMVRAPLYDHNMLLPVSPTKPLINDNTLLLVLTSIMLSPA